MGWDTSSEVEIRHYKGEHILASLICSSAPPWFLPVVAGLPVVIFLILILIFFESSKEGHISQLKWSLHYSKIILGNQIEWYLRSKINSSYLNLCIKDQLSSRALQRQQRTSQKRGPLLSGGSRPSRGRSRSRDALNIWRIGRTNGHFGTL